MTSNEKFHWIDTAFLEKILAANDGGSRTQVVKFTLEPATKKGDNYASDMLKCRLWRRGSVHKEITEQTVILKIIPSGEIQLKVLVKGNIFPREIHAYNDVIGEIQKHLRSIGDLTEISPRCLYTQLEPKTMLAFEDLKTRDYQMYDRRLLLDLKHTELVMQKLAKLHAASIVVHQQNTTSMGPFLEGSISDNPNRQDFLVFFEMAPRALRQQLEQWGPEWQTIAKKMHKDFGKTMIRKGIELYRRHETSFNVFNHNDVWINNLMFKYLDDSVTDVLLVDYQLSYWGSPGIDINYFLHGSVKDEVLEEHFEELIEVYFRMLQSTLKQLLPNHASISKAQILAEVANKGYLALNVAFCLMPLNFMINSENCSMDLLLQETLAGDEFRATLFGNPRYVEYMKKRLPALDKLGYLN